MFLGKILGKETRDTLWTLITPPAVWAWHFLICYIAAAYACAPNSRTFQNLGGVRVAIGVLTLVALTVIGLAGIRAFREWHRRKGPFPYDEDTPEDREAYLEFSTTLLAALSFVAVIFTALPALLIGDCR